MIVQLIQTDSKKRLISKLLKGGIYTRLMVFSRVTLQSCYFSIHTLFIPSSSIFSHSYRALRTHFYTIFFYILSCLQGASHPFLYHLLLYSLILTGRFEHIFIPSSSIFYHSYRALRAPFYTIFYYFLSCLQGASHPF